MHRFHLKLFTPSTRTRLSLFSSAPFLPKSSNKSQKLEYFPGADVIFMKVPIGSTPEEVQKTLSLEKECLNVRLSTLLVQTLLSHFKNDWKSALGVFNWAGSRLDYEHSPETYTLMVDILGKMKQMDQMKYLMEDMRRNKLGCLETIAKAMRRYSGAGQWRDAVKLFDCLAEFGLSKNTESMNILLDTLCKEGKIVHARAIFLELKDHIPPDPRTFNILIYGWCKINRIEEAEWTIKEMKGYGCNPSVISYSTIINKYCLSSKFSKALELLDVLESNGCKANTVTYTTIMSKMAKHGEFDQALNLAQRMQKLGYDPDTLYYNVLIFVLWKSGRTKEAIEVFSSEMLDAGVLPNTSTYNTIISMYCHVGDVQSALDLLEEIENVGDCHPDNLTYYPLFKFCFRTGKVDHLLMKLLNDMTCKHHLSLDGSAYMLLIHGFCRVNKCHMAYDLFEELIHKDIKPKIQTCRVLLDAVRFNNMYNAIEKIESVMMNF